MSVCFAGLRLYERLLRRSRWCMDAAAMSLELHGCGNHVVRTDGPSVLTTDPLVSVVATDAPEGRPVKA